MTSKILLKLPHQSKPVAVVPQVYLNGQHGYVSFGPIQIGSNADVLVSELRRLIDDLQPVIQHSPFDRVLTITPQEVIDYFQNSPILSSMASDVREVLKNSVAEQIAAPQSELQTDLEQVFKAGLDAECLLADISEVLTGDRYYSGKTYNRVKAVKDALKSSSSTPKKAVEGKEEEQEAA